MNSSAPVIASVVGILTLVFMGLLFVASIVGACLALAGRPGSGLRRVGRAISIPCGSVLGLLLFMGLSLLGIRTTRWESRVPITPTPQTRFERQVGPPRVPVPQTRFERTIGSPSVPTPSSVQTLPASDTSPTVPTASTNLTPNEDRTVADESSVKKPDWVTQPMRNSGDVVHAALSSQQYATVEEARNELARQVRTGLIKDFEHVYGVKFNGINNLPVETIKSIAVRQEYVETVQRDFGSFFAPMHRVWWQFELSPVVRTDLHGIWKASAQENRTIMIGGSLIAATLGFAGLSLLSRRKKAVPATPAPKDPSGVVLGVGAATLVAQKCRRWWQSK